MRITRREVLSLTTSLLIVLLLLTQIVQDRKAERAYAKFAAEIDSLHATVKAWE